MKTPDRIWLVNLGDAVVWHDDPRPTGYEEAHDSVEYVRVGGQPSAEPVAWMTHHAEPMLFPSEREAASYCGDGEGPVALIRLSDYEALQAECGKLRKDAERYRWLRDSDDYELCAVRIDYWCDEYIGQAACEVLGGDYLDRDIDAAMAQQGPGNGKREDEK